jgi:hypothetical protein
MAIRDLWIDFNDADRQHRVSTLRRFATPGTRIEVGQRVRVADDEGNFCWAEVTSIVDESIELVLDPGTFTCAEDPEDCEALFAGR